ncbi:MAG: hypothetical protein HY895_02870 [Deltaproteobacteria bacterium]|nr:hypothetical protein [Deltaproteobacteria bacterium]
MSSVSLGINIAAMPIDGLDEVHAAFSMSGFPIKSAALVILQGLSITANGKQIRRAQIDDGAIKKFHCPHL